MAGCFSLENVQIVFYGNIIPAIRCIFPLRYKYAAPIGFKELKPVQKTCQLNPIAMKSP